MLLLRNRVIPVVLEAASVRVGLTTAQRVSAVLMN